MVEHNNVLRLENLPFLFVFRKRLLEAASLFDHFITFFKNPSAPFWLALLSATYPKNKNFHKQESKLLFFPSNYLMLIKSIVDGIYNHSKSSQPLDKT